MKCRNFFAFPLLVLLLGMRNLKYIVLITNKYSIYINTIIYIEIYSRCVKIVLAKFTFDTTRVNYIMIIMDQ